MIQSGRQLDPASRDERMRPLIFNCSVSRNRLRWFADNGAIRAHQTFTDGGLRLAAAFGKPVFDKEDVGAHHAP